MRILLLLAGLLAATACTNTQDGDPTSSAPPLATPSVTADGEANTPSATPSTVLEDGLVALTVTDGKGSAVVYVELATTSAERTRGLMFREELAEDRGMLFVYDRDHMTGFWMKDTPLPLDIAYLAADGTVLEIREGVPFSELLLPPQGPYRYTLELNRGWFERNGFGVGSVVVIPAGLPGSE